MNNQEQEKAVLFQPGDKVRFVNGYEKCFIGDGVFTVKHTEIRGDRVIVKLDGVIPKFDQTALEKVNDVIDIETMISAFNHCCSDETCEHCALAGERASCAEKWQEAVRKYKKQVEKDILAYKTELAIFNTLAQSVILKNNCPTCYIKKACPCREEVEREKERDFGDCIAAFRAVYAAYYDSYPDNLKKELSGYMYKEGGDND